MSLIFLGAERMSTGLQAPGHPNAACRQECSPCGGGRPGSDLAGGQYGRGTLFLMPPMFSRSRVRPVGLASWIFAHDGEASPRFGMGFCGFEAGAAGRLSTEGWALQNC